MKILRGRYADHTATLQGFANDWMQVDLEGGRQGAIVRPDQVQLDNAERAEVLAKPGEHAGRFWDEWRLNDDGTFTALKQRQPRRSRRTAAAPKPEHINCEHDPEGTDGNPFAAAVCSPRVPPLSSHPDCECPGGPARRVVDPFGRCPLHGATTGSPAVAAPASCPSCGAATRDGDLKAGRNAIDRGDGPEWCDDEWHDAVAPASAPYSQEVPGA